MPTRRFLLLTVSLVVLSLAVPLLVSSSPVHATGTVLTAAGPSTPVAQKPPPTNTASGDTIVYKTKTGKAYHKAGCSLLSTGKLEIRLKDAVATGLTPCKTCKPPVPAR